MNNEKGMTLIELLVAIVIAGIIVVPLVTLMVSTLTVSQSQGKETNIAYVAQEVMEKVVHQTPTLGIGQYCWSNMEGQCSGYTLLTNLYSNSAVHDEVVVIVRVTDYEGPFHEVTVKVLNETTVSNGSNEVARENEIELVTVVRTP
ncbi:type II secretion system GspH family protein [Alkalihalobacillus sp. MEB130]|uniref:type IV pilus modification PilV family protein n=1 Tax=Alkalihalobacillus sp. MEB130 TaxID=2976704 RepID=UPI0028DE195B|nr:type II secretion system protein [Alkalihalobacillus sp. MEB130]MDT8859510.1 type II secretion system GspH family protein [Alkalihalobacillus sp. MEB130]